MKQIAVLRSESRGTNFYRIDNPVHFSREKLILREIHLPVDNYIKALAGCDMLFISMPTDKHALWIIMAAKSIGIPVVCDIDDLITPDYGDVFTDHRDCLDLADLVICATQELEDFYPQYKTVVIENFLDINLVPRKKRKALRPTIVVRGSMARVEDYRYYQDLFIEIEQRLHPKWYFMGYSPDFFTPLLGETILFSEPMRFFNKLCEINPHFIFHPIMDTLLNRCKSKSVYWEAAMCQAQLVTTATWWDEPNIITEVQDMSLPPQPAIKDEYHIAEQINKFKQVIYDHSRS